MNERVKMMLHDNIRNATGQDRQLEMIGAAERFVIEMRIEQLKPSPEKIAVYLEMWKQFCMRSEFQIDINLFQTKLEEYGYA